uniref:Uncharacterized protein n=1 Tax=Anguilla anguilla TaxID=7936 RepID=A0A0E9R452_ANGAN
MGYFVLLLFNNFVVAICLVWKLANSNWPKF